MWEEVERDWGKEGNHRDCRDATMMEEVAGLMRGVASSGFSLAGLGPDGWGLFPFYSGWDELTRARLRIPIFDEKMNK